MLSEDGALTGTKRTFQKPDSVVLLQQAIQEVSNMATLSNGLNRWFLTVAAITHTHTHTISEAEQVLFSSGMS